jgi:hypothetical protein
VLGNNAEGGGFAFAALDSDSESNWTSSSSDTDSDADTMNWKVSPQNYATVPKSLSIITPVTNIDVEQMKNMKHQLYKRMATAPSADASLKDWSNLDNDDNHTTLSAQSSPAKKPIIQKAVTPSQSIMANMMIGGARNRSHVVRGKTVVWLPPKDTRNSVKTDTTASLFDHKHAHNHHHRKNRRRKKSKKSHHKHRRSVDLHPICQQALSAWQPSCHTMMLMSLILSSCTIFALLSGLLLDSHHNFVEYYVQYV